MQRTSRTLCLTTLLFAAGAALFFTKAAVIPYKVAYPVLLLSLFYLRLKPLIPVGAALLLSAVGDAAGAGGMFIPQMLFFALAHGAYMCYFLPQAQLAPRPFVWPVLTALLLFLFVCIVPRAADPPNARASPSTDSSSRACCTARFSTAERMPHGSALRPCCLSFPTP